MNQNWFFTTTKKTFLVTLLKTKFINEFLNLFFFFFFLFLSLFFTFNFHFFRDWKSKRTQKNKNKQIAGVCVCALSRFFFYLNTLLRPGICQTKSIHFFFLHNSPTSIYNLSNCSNCPLNMFNSSAIGYFQIFKWNNYEWRTLNHSSNETTTKNEKKNK